MKYYLEKLESLEHGGDVIEFRLKIFPLDLRRMERLDELDRLLLKECEKSEKCSDKLLALETIVRRIEQGS